jgi:hypothetical protein
MKSYQKKPGPKRLDYIPVPFRGIKGADQLTTVRQLENLQDYIETPESERPPCVRIGASVPQYSEETPKVPTTTYAVTVDGIVSVVKMERDPRSAHKWFMNPRRPWHLSARYASTTVGGV